MKRTVLCMMAAVALAGAMFTGCKKDNAAEAKKNVENFYSQISSPEFKKDAREKGFEDWNVEMSDSDIVTRITLGNDLHFTSKVASRDWVDAQRQLTLDNYKGMVASDSLVSKAFAGMRTLDMKYRAVYYDCAGDSVTFVILPEEVVGK